MRFGPKVSPQIRSYWMLLSNCWYTEHRFVGFFFTPKVGVWR